MALAADALVAALRTAIGERTVLTDADLRAQFETDWTRRFHGDALCVALPRSTEEVAEVLRLCNEAGVPVVPQGGNSGLAGGGVPRNNEVVLSLQRLQELGPVDAEAGQVVAGAGVTLERLQQHVAAAGFAFGVDMASRGSATIGGMVATNAGGIHVLRYGPMRQQVVGLEAVLPNGSIVRRMSGVTKDTAGYDLTALLAGSEGTLAVITKVLLRLVRPPARSAVALLAMKDLAAAVAIVRDLRDTLPGLQAAEVFFDDGLELVRTHSGLPRPFAEKAPLYLLLEVASDSDPALALAEALAKRDGVVASALATEPAERERLWAYRERHTESINAEGVPHKFDVAVPLGRLPAFESQLRTLLDEAAPEARLVLFGHLAEGNFHVNLLGLPPDDERVDRLVLELVSQFGGSISSEHGIGQAKVDYLALTRTETEIAAMRAIKVALDPRGILNPGVVFPSKDGGEG